MHYSWIGYILFFSSVMGVSCGGLSSYANIDQIICETSNVPKKFTNKFEEMVWHLRNHYHSLPISFESDISKFNSSGSSTNIDEACSNLLRTLKDKYTYLLPECDLTRKLETYEGSRNGLGFKATRSHFRKMNRCQKVMKTRWNNANSEKKNITLIPSLIRHCQQFTSRLSGKGFGWFFPVEVSRVDANGPAERAGIESGDYLLSINGWKLRKWSRWMWWPKDESNVIKHYYQDTHLPYSHDSWNITVGKHDDDGDDRVETVSIVTEDIPLPTISSISQQNFGERIPTLHGIGDSGDSSNQLIDMYPIDYVKISHFSEQTPKELQQFMEKSRPQTNVDAFQFSTRTICDRLRNWVASMIASNVPVVPKGLVLDLRGNLGGSFRAAIESAALFLPMGAPIVIVDSKCLRQVQGGLENNYLMAPSSITNCTTIVSLNKRADINSPMLILTDAATASASEILTAALVDNNRATSMGQTSLGKDVAQAVVRLCDNSGLSYTIAKYFGPFKRCLENGITPQIELTDDELVTVNPVQDIIYDKKFKSWHIRKAKNK